MRVVGYVIAALAVAHLMETLSDQSIKRVVRTLKNNRNFELNVGGQTIHAAVPLLLEIQHLINTIAYPALRH